MLLPVGNLTSLEERHQFGCLLISQLHCRGLKTNPLVASTRAGWQVDFLHCVGDFSPLCSRWLSRAFLHCVHSRWLSGGEKKIYSHPPPSLTPHLGGTLKDGKDVQTLHTLSTPPSSHHAQAKKAFGNVAMWQCCNVAMWPPSSMLPGWPAARWLCWPVTNSNCPHKKLQVAAPPFPRLPTYNL